MNTFLSAVVFLAICAAIIFVGWEEPLRYRFLSPQQIREIEQPAGPAAPPPATGELPRSSQWRPMGTALDRAPYKTHNDGVDYTGNIDFREMGTRSEQERKENLTGGKGGR